MTAEYHTDYQALVQFGGPKCEVLITYPTEYCAKRASDWLKNVAETYNRAAKEEGKLKPVIYIYGTELNPLSFMLKLAMITEAAGCTVYLSPALNWGY